MKKFWGDFREATPIRKEVNDIVLTRCTGLKIFSDLMNISLVFFCASDFYARFDPQDAQVG